ncbi:MAG: DUF3592 domain-containing protein [Planctomycetota bacterium]
MDCTTFPNPPKDSAIHLKRHENGVELSCAKFAGHAGADEALLYRAGIGGLILMMLIVGWFGWMLIRDIGDPAVQFPEGFTREGFFCAAAAFLAVVFAFLVFGLIGLLRELRIATRKAPTHAWTLRLEATQWSWTLHQMGKTSTGTCDTREIDRIVLNSECQVIAQRKRRRNTLTTSLSAADADWLGKHLNQFLGGSDQLIVLNTARRTAAAFGFVTLAIGLAALGMSIAPVVEHRLFASTALRAEGVVTDVVWGDEDADLAKVEYKVAGKTFEIQSEIATSPAAFRVGETVTVLYQLGKPEKGRIDSFSQRWLMPLIIGASALIMLAISATLFLVPALERRGIVRLESAGDGGGFTVKWLGKSETN